MKGNTKSRPSVRQRTGGKLVVREMHDQDGETRFVKLPGQYTGGSRRLNRLADRLAAHQEYPVAADGKQYNGSKPKARKPGSMNPRKH